MTRIELKIAGYGGQGVITLSKLLSSLSMYAVAMAVKPSPRVATPHST